MVSQQRDYRAEYERRKRLAGAGATAREATGHPRRSVGHDHDVARHSPDGAIDYSELTGNDRDDVGARVDLSAERDLERESTIAVNVDGLECHDEPPGVGASSVRIDCDTTGYAAFLASKRKVVADHGRIVDDADVHPSLFVFQRAITRWALRKGRAAVFADTGLGKTRIQVEWARLTGERTLILAPLAVAQQTVREAASIGVLVRYVRDQADADGRLDLDRATNGNSIHITNYERLHLFDPTAFGAVVLDESSVLKSFSGTTKKALVRSFADTPYRLCCTATPAPNDLEELCNHADFLGVMKPSEMRSTFFIADQRGEFMRYRLKRHAKEAFFRWLASWATAVKRPSDLGFDDGPFLLPGLDIDAHYVDTKWVPDGQLFTTELKGVAEQSAVRRETMGERVARAVELVNAEPDEPWLIWCGLNDESTALARAIPGAVEVVGSDDPDAKAERLAAFADGTIRVLVTKPSIAGFGMNFQRCARMAFVGLGYSYEQYYQALRRCHRFGQTRRVHAHIVLSEPERGVYSTVLDKERQALELSGGLLEGMRDRGRAALFAGTSKGDTYEPRRQLTLPDWMKESA
jgi:superfamily II DNA or RNA helicase